MVPGNQDSSKKLIITLDNAIWEHQTWDTKFKPGSNCTFSWFSVNSKPRSLTQEVLPRSQWKYHIHLKNTLPPSRYFPPLTYYILKVLWGTNHIFSEVLTIYTKSYQVLQRYLFNRQKERRSQRIEYVLKKRGFKCLMLTKFCPSS